MIIGNKDIFAVEFIIDEQNPQMGYGKLWIQNVFLGTIEDYIFLNGYLLSLLNEIIASQTIQVNIENKNKEEIFKSIKSTNKKRSVYKVMGATFTDDFEIYSFENNGEICLVWRLRSAIEMIFEDLKNYNREIHFAHAPKKEILSVKEQFLKEITP